MKKKKKPLPKPRNPNWKLPPPKVIPNKKKDYVPDYKKEY
tara:strand:+ start:2259 stop:2378 length:120 start_codon:yes stop_codon:yes gene_type:complete